MLAAPRGARPQLAEPRGELIARALQLAEPCDARPARGSDRHRRRARPGGSGDEREAVGQHRGELVLEPRDLGAKRGARGQLGVDRGRRKIERPRRRPRRLAGVVGAVCDWLAALDQKLSSSVPPGNSDATSGSARERRFYGASSALALAHSASSAYSAGTPGTRTE
jgi:hypothetical protein